MKVFIFITLIVSLTACSSDDGGSPRACVAAENNISRILCLSKGPDVPVVNCVGADPGPRNEDEACYSDALIGGCAPIEINYQAVDLPFPYTIIDDRNGEELVIETIPASINTDNREFRIIRYADDAPGTSTVDMPACF